MYADCEGVYTNEQEDKEEMMNEGCFSEGGGGGGKL